MNLSFFSKKNVVYIILGSTLCALSIGYLNLAYEWKEVFVALAEISYPILIVKICGIHCCYLFLRTWRLFFLVRRINYKISFSELYIITAIVVGLAMLTPGQMGELLKIELLKRRALLDRLPGLGSFAVERFTDLLAITVFGCLGFLGLDGDHRDFIVPLGGGLGLIILSALLIIPFFFREKALPAWCLHIRSGCGTLWIWLRVFALTMFSWGCVYWTWILILNTVQVHIHFWDIAWLLFVVTIGTILSFMPGGFGMADVITVELLIGLGAESMAAQTGAVLLRLYGLMIAGFGLIHFFAYSIYIYIKKI